MSEGDRFIRLERHGGYVALRLLAEGWREVGQAAVAALARACGSLAEDDSARAVVLIGEEGGFCGDWSAAELERVAQRAGYFAQAFAPLATLPQPVIAALAGATHGAALELALAADVRLAAEDATFRLVGTATAPLAGGLTRLERAVGRAATWIALTDAELTAAEASRVGLISAALPTGALAAEAERLAEVIASRGPIAVRYAKEVLQRGPELTLDQALQVETDLTIILQTTADRAEGVMAFAEKRQPRFQGT